MVLLLCCLCKVCSCIYVRFGYYSLDLAKGEVLVWKTKLFVGFVFFSLCFYWGKMTRRFIFSSWIFYWILYPLFFCLLKFSLIFLWFDFWMLENFYGKFGFGFLGKILGLVIFLLREIWSNFFVGWFFGENFFDDFFFGLKKIPKNFLVIFLRLKFLVQIFGHGFLVV